MGCLKEEVFVAVELGQLAHLGAGVAGDAGDLVQVLEGAVEGGVEHALHCVDVAEELLEGGTLLDPRVVDVGLDDLGDLHVIEVDAAEQRDGAGGGDDVAADQLLKDAEEEVRHDRGAQQCIASQLAELKLALQEHVEELFGASRRQRPC